MSESTNTRRNPVRLRRFLEVHAEAVAAGEGRKFIADKLGMTPDSVSARICALKREKGVVLDPLSSSQGRTSRSTDEIQAMIADIKAGLESEVVDTESDSTDA